MHEDDRGGRRFERALHLLDSTDLLYFSGDQLVALAEKQAADCSLSAKGQ